jgi:hypothetical protein
VIEIAGSAFSGTGITSFTFRDFALRDALFMQPVTLLHCFGSAESIKIPANVREIGEKAFLLLIASKF